MREGDIPGPSAARGERPSHLIVARILGPHGLQGEVKAEVLTGFPDRFGVLQTVYVGDELAPAVLEGHRRQGGKIILKLEGCEDREKAAQLQGKFVHVALEEAVPLAEDEYYVYQIVGLEVWSTEGEFLGYVDEVLHTGSNDVYVVKNGRGEVLVPALSDVVTEVDLERRRIEVRLVEGLR